MGQPPVPLEHVVAQIAQAPDTMQAVRGTGLRLFHVWKEQVRSVASSENLPSEERIQRFVLETYRPFPSLWRWFCPNEEHYRAWAGTGMDQIAGDADGCLRFAMEADFSSLFHTAAQRLQRVTGREAGGDWYLVYSEGGDLGGNGGTMCANLIRLAQRGVGHLGFMLPHELTHQIYHRAHPACPHSLVRSIVEEGFCCYVNWLCWESHGSPASHTDFTDADWAWAVAHERHVIAAVLPQLESTAWETVKPYHQWHVYPYDGAVDRLAYFLGFRLCETYARRYGQNALADFYALKPMDIWTRSGYAVQA